MRSIDTNVVLRLLVNDDADQRARATALVRQLRGEGFRISEVVLVETIWVLRSAYRFDRATVATAVRTLLSLEGVVVADLERVSRALVAFETGTADFADFLIREAARDAQALPVMTFDARFAQSSDVELVR